MYDPFQQTIYVGFDHYFSTKPTLWIFMIFHVPCYPSVAQKLPHNLSNMLDILKASHVPVHLPKVKRDSNSTPVHMKMLEKVNAKI